MCQQNHPRNHFLIVKELFYPVLKVKVCMLSGIRVQKDFQISSRVNQTLLKSLIYNCKTFFNKYMILLIDNHYIELIQ